VIVFGDYLIFYGESPRSVIIERVLRGDIQGLS
jgi:hypothetical protein